MTSQPVEANVVLTADTTGYDSSMQGSAAQTDQLGKSVDSLTGKIDKLAKSASHKMFTFAAADIAGITAATAAYSAWERQMTSLSAQAAVLNRNVAAQQATFNSYASSVDSLRNKFGTTTANAAELVQTLSKFSDNTTSVDKLATTFTKLGNSTQESSTQLAQSMLQLQRSMGTPQRDTEKYANQLATLSANSSASAQSILGFAQQLAPVGRLVNMSQTDIMGISTAFQKAGQDGYQAANVFSKMMSDVAYASQSGSPDLAKYANLVGMTVGQFKELGGTDQFLKIFDSINRQGPQAITTLNRMGLDGMRTVRTITSMAQQSGGIQQALDQARGADSGTIDRGSEAAMNTMTHHLAELRSQLAMTGESFGKNFSGPAKAFVGLITSMTQAVKTLVDSPFGKLAALVAGVAAPFLLAAGAITAASKALLAFSAANMFLRNSATFGFREGRRGYGAIGQEGRPLGPAGQRMAADGSWLQRRMFSGSARLGQMVGPPSGAGLFSRSAGYGLAGAGYLGGMGARLLGMQYSAGTVRGLDNPELRERMFNARTFGGSVAGTWHTATGPMSGWTNDRLDALRRRIDPNTGFARTNAPPGSMSASGSAMDSSPLSRSTQGFMSNIDKTARAMGEAEKSTMRFSTGLRSGLSNVARGLAALGVNMTSAAGGAGIAAGRGIKGAAGSAFEGLFGSNPWALGLTAAMVALPMYAGKGHDPYTAPNNSGILNPYLQAGGLNPAQQFSPTRIANQENRTAGDARYISQADRYAASSMNYKLTNHQIKGKPQDVALTMLAPQFSTMKNNKTALNALALDLTKEYGAGQAQQMMNQLAAGTAFDPSAIVASTQQVTGNKVGDRFGDLFGAYKDQSNQLVQQRGAAGVGAAARLQGVQLGQSLQLVGQQYGPMINRHMEGDQYTDPFRHTRGEFFKNFFSSGMGVDITDDQARGLKIDPNATSGRGATRDVLSQIFTKGGDKDLQSQLLSRYSVNEGGGNKATIQRLLSAIYGGNVSTPGPGLDDSIQARVGGLFDTKQVRKAVMQPENVNAQLKAVDQMVDSMQRAGKTAPQITEIMGQVKSVVGDDTNQKYILANAAQQEVQRRQAWVMPGLSRTAQFGMQARNFQSTFQGAIGDPHQKEIQQGAEDTFAQQVESQRQYFVQMLTAQREFNVMRGRAQEDFGVQRQRMDYDFNLSRDRAEEDFHQQQMYNAEDYHRSRGRAEFDFHLQRTRQQDDYQLQMKRGYTDFTLSRKRQEQDFQHSVTQMVKQSAMQYADIYKRIQVQRTTSGGYLAFNAGEQLQQMRQQTGNLSTLRDRGLSNAAIQQLKLTDPNNAQQLNRLVGDTASDPRLIKQLNKAINERMKAARKLVTDESSNDWEEFNRQYKLARTRGKEDFERQVERSNADFHKQMKRQEDDFQRSLNRQGQDYQTAQDRANDQFHKSMRRASADYSTTTERMTDDFHKQMKRAAADLERSAETIDGNMADILRKATKRLSGHAKTQAETVLKQFNGLRRSTTGISTDLMETISQIFGVDFKAPKSAKPSAQAAKYRSEIADMRNYAEGGVLPGYSPGKDNHRYVSPTGGVLNLSGGEAVMRPEWTRAVGGPAAVDEMNRAAKSGTMQAFAEGGVFKNPDGKFNWGGMYISRIAAAQIRLAEQVSGINMRLMQGGYGGNHVAASGTSHNYPGVADLGPGSIASEKILRRVGFAAWARNIPGRSSVGSGAHVHAVSLLDPGDARSPQVYGSWARHGNGLSGANNDPAPHYAWLPNLRERLGAMNLHALGGSGPMGSGRSIGSVLKLLYPGAEQSARELSSIHPLNQGDISHIINARAIKAYSRMLNKYGDPYGSPGTGMSGMNIAAGRFDHNEKVPQTVHAAIAYGKRMADERGWTGSHWADLFKLWQSESGWRWNADNPSSSAYGIPQALPGSKMASFGRDWRTNPGTQIDWGMNYIANRYGGPTRAWDFHKRHNWYGEGAIFSKGPQTIGVGETGPEMVLPLDDRGADFLTALMKKILPGSAAKDGNTHGYAAPATIHNMHSYQIDKSTTFSGPITVQANDPNMLITQLQARARLSALSNAAKGGVKIA